MGPWGRCRGYHDRGARKFRVSIKRVIGVDEAGYGPNLGPLVVAATVWDVPDDWDENAIWRAFEGVVSATFTSEPTSVHIADSKQVHSAGKGIARLERSATILLELAGQNRDSFGALWDELHPGNCRRDCREPWFRERDALLPRAVPVGLAKLVAGGWRTRCQEQNCCLVRCAADVVVAERFNREVDRAGTKGRVLSEATLRLVRRVWRPDGEESAEPTRTIVFCDKHGGRDRYAELLADCFPEAMPLTLEETRARSRYRIRNAEFRFQAKSEEHLPVAAASLVAKYLRELSMDLLNEYWMEHVPELKPTRGYPVDARRFLEAIQGRATEMELSPDWYWRRR